MIRNLIPELSNYFCVILQHLQQLTCTLMLWLLYDRAGSIVLICLSNMMHCLLKLLQNSQEIDWRQVETTPCLNSSREPLIYLTETGEPMDNPSASQCSLLFKELIKNDVFKLKGHIETLQIEIGVRFCKIADGEWVGPNIYCSAEMFGVIFFQSAVLTQQVITLLKLWHKTMNRNTLKTLLFHNRRNKNGQVVSIEVLGFHKTPSY